MGSEMCIRDRPNISTMVGGLYDLGDPRRDGGFTIFYIGINIGAFLAPLVCGYLGMSENWGWHYGFGAAGIGMLAGLIFFWKGLNDGVFGNNGEQPDEYKKKNDHFAEFIESHLIKTNNLEEKIGQSSVVECVVGHGNLFCPYRRIH